MNELTINAQINNEAKLLTAELNDLKDFKNANKNTILIITYKAYKPKTSEALKGFYYTKMVNDFRRFYAEKGYHYSKEKTEYQMRCLIPMMREETMNYTTAKWSWRIKEFEELDDPDRLFFIELLKKFAAEQGFIISDQTTWK